MDENNDLVLGVIQGDRQALNTFYERYYRLVWRILIQLNVPAQTQEDLFQDVFVRILEKDCQRLRQWRGENLTAYIGQLVRNLALDYFRTMCVKNRHESSLTPSTDNMETDRNLATDLLFPSPEANVLRQELLDILRSAMAELSERDRELLHRFYSLQETYDEIMAAMGLSSSNVGVSLGRVRERLKKKLTTTHPDLFPS